MELRIEVERKLHTATELIDLQWYAAAENIIQCGYDLDLIAHDCADELATQVAFELIPVTDLRAGVQWTAALNREVFELYGGWRADMHVDDYAEAVTRRLAFRAGRRALSLTRKETQRFALRARLGGHNANDR